ncbi:hypothetical protein CSAL01_08844 [Colletotrichum salicis]|uniref:Uncharacterized protein n=1 Tax=Colletotrichum salicis TaxID=1209931 RepID=A0A135TKH5_9PEZI|nr:hypothetical protein CSAL01_08844 [Colletotrichum salicis]
MDSNNPPRPDVSKARPWGTQFDIPNVDNQFEPGDGDFMDAIPFVWVAHEDDTGLGQLDVWFTLLLQPFGRFPLAAFGDPSHEEEILKDVHHLYGFLAAQIANFEKRLNMTEHSRQGPPPPPLTLVATSTYFNRNRLVQNPIITYVIVGILALTATSQILMLVSSFLSSIRGKQTLLHMKVEGLAPDGSNSIAAMTALLKGSNAMDHLPKGAERMSKKELNEKLSGLRFRMGWFWRESTQTRHYTIGVLDDEDFELLENKHDIAREDALLRYPPE